jgi:hypothetical protein
MPQFPRRSAQPPRPDSYARTARMVRERADMIEAVRDPQTPQERYRLTVAVDALYRLTRSLWHRHHGRNPVAEDAEAFRARIALDKERGL